MQVSINNAIIAGVIGMISRAIGSLIAPWVQWGIEKKRKKFERRVALIQRWREIISKKDFNRAELLNHPDYGRLRDLLNETVKKQIERPLDNNQAIIILPPPITNHDKDLVVREIARIEKSWNLI